VSVAGEQHVFYSQRRTQTVFTLKTNQSRTGPVHSHDMATTEQITITVRDLEAAGRATQNAAPTEEVVVARTAHVILLVWRENQTPRHATIQDGEILPNSGS
jgi:hypothetical protein